MKLSVFRVFSIFLVTVFLSACIEDDSDDDGLKEEANQPPVAILNYENLQVEVGEQALFLDSDSFDPDGEIVSRRWNLGDGTVSADAALDHSYIAPGDYSVTLTITDNDGAISEVTAMVRVVNPARPKLAMPIEVLGKGEPGTPTVKTRQFTLHDSTKPELISLTCHRCDYRDSGVNQDRPAKASLRINSGRWINISDETVDVAEPEKSYGGLFGAYHTVRFTMPVSDLIEGENSVEFRFNGTDGFTNGYRIIKLNLLDSEGNQLLPDDQFVWDDPIMWTAPHETQGDIQLGRELWNGKVALDESPLSDTKIQASCANCHASDGSDLKYFNYSNEAIKVRAEFHGLTSKQGEQIASYIRSLQTAAPRQARPWNPPYQPGPGLDGRPVEEWAAGAGLDAVLDNDFEMLEEMFPDGTSDAELRKVMSTRNTINVREQRIALQLPDWKMWLPEVHPLDLWGEDWESLGDDSRTVESDFAKLTKAELSRMRSDENSVSEQELINFVDGFTKNIRSVVGGIGGPQPCLNEGIYRSDGYKALVENGFITRPATGADRNDGLAFKRPPDLNENPDACETWARAMMHVTAVKSWELHTRFGLEDAAPDLYPYGEKRSWLGSQRAVFGMASHRTGNDSNLFKHLTRGESSYISHAWYQLQVILNSGNRNPQNHRPPDWKYQMSWLWANRRDNNVPSTLRYVQTLIKMQQNLDMRAPINQPGGVPDVGDHYPFLQDRGPSLNGWWTTTHVGPQRFVSIGGSFFNIGANQASIWLDMDDWNAFLRERLQSHLLKAFLDKTLTYDIDQFQRGNGQNKLSPESEVPTFYGGSGRLGDSQSDHNQTYRSIPLMRDFGMSEIQIARLIDWGERMWPNGDWESLRIP